VQWAFIDTLAADNLLASPADRFNNNYLRNDNFKWTNNHQNLNPRPVWNTLYKYRSDFLYGADKKEAIVVHFNPVLNLGIGGETADGRYTYLNTRGAQIHGMIDGKVGFYAYLGENQMRPPTYVRQFISQYTVVPHEGFWKTFGDSGYDFFTATGYIYPCMAYQLHQFVYPDICRCLRPVGRLNRQYRFSEKVPDRPPPEF